MAKLFANSGDPDQTLLSTAIDLGMHCLPIILLGVTRLKWINLQEIPSANYATSLDDQDLYYLNIPKWNSFSWCGSHI